MKKHKSRMHKLLFEDMTRVQLAHLQVVLVDNLYRDMDCFSRLLKFYTHFVDTVDDSFAALHRFKTKSTRKVC